MEYNIEAPEDIVENISKVISKAMLKGAEPFCTRLPLTATAEINDYWVH